MLRRCCVLAIATRTPMGGDPFAFVEDLDRVGRDPRLDLLTGKAIGYGVKVLVDIDMIIETGLRIFHSAKTYRSTGSGRRAG